MLNQLLLLKKYFAYIKLIKIQIKRDVVQLNIFLESEGKFDNVKIHVIEYVNAPDNLTEQKLW